MGKLLNILLPNKLFEMQTTAKPIKSGFMVIGVDGVARMDYADPKLREHLKKQMTDFSKITVAD